MGVALGAQGCVPLWWRDVVARTPCRMIGLSVAVGRFVEALFWAILRVAGLIGGVALLVVAVLVVAWMLLRRRRR
ncbi:hypothetical protein [uncultured Sphingomonas sp.]|uniref:hypothetical protein n=1 Tax=uncultured Sphingomonas sp. TaxID=158754 RepID=UPI0026107A58|nr:hypothetical protein [uncultured Sphingomonas sp.]